MRVQSHLLLAKTDQYKWFEIGTNTHTTKADKLSEKFQGVAGRSFLIKKNYVIDFGILNRAFSFLHIVKAAFDPSIETKFLSKIFIRFR